MREETMIEAIHDIDSIRCMVEDIHEEITNTPDYWTRLEHTYAGMAMQSLIMTSTHNFGTTEQIAMWANEYAIALVKELKEERK